MFTGIVTDIGEISKLDQKGDLTARILTNYDMETVDLGASIACNGICLTVTGKGQDGARGWFDVDVSAESVSKTNIATGRKAWASGAKINLERALKIGDELGGHIVSGHVDGLATISSIEEVGDSSVVTFEAPQELAKFIAEKGSVTLDGTSLTVNAVQENMFTVNLIPHTKQATIWSDMQTGDAVNLEIDTLARYVARLNEVHERNSAFKSSQEHIEIA